MNKLQIITILTALENLAAALEEEPMYILDCLIVGSSIDAEDASKLKTEFYNYSTLGCSKDLASCMPKNSKENVE